MENDEIRDLASKVVELISKKIVASVCKNPLFDANSRKLEVISSYQTA